MLSSVHATMRLLPRGPRVLERRGAGHVDAERPFSGELERKAALALIIDIDVHLAVLHQDHEPVNRQIL